MLFAVFAMLCSTVAAILQADAADHGGRTSAVLARPRFLCGIAMDIVTWLCMVVALQFIPIFAVQATLAGAIAMTALYARYFRGEWLRPVHRLAIGASMLGLAFVAGSAGTERKQALTGHGTTVAVLIAALVAIMGVTLAIANSTKPWPSAVLAGLGLGGGSVCIRAMHVSDGVDLGSLLREPLAGLARAQAVVLTRATLVDAHRRESIRATLASACGGRLPAVWAEAAHRPVQFRTASGAALPLAALAGKRIVAFAGIGNPSAFRATLEDLGAEVVGFRPFADHHAYTAHDLSALAASARAAGADLAVTTLKDLVKVRSDTLGDTPLAAIEIAIEITSGGAALEALLAPIIGRVRSIA